MNKKKTKKTIKYILLSVLVACSLYAGYVYIQVRAVTNVFKPFLPEKSADIKRYMSRDKSNTITLLIHNKGGIDYSSYIYVIEGEYNDLKVPDEDKHIKYPPDTAIYIIQEGESGFAIYSDRSPEYNSINDSTLLNIIVNSAAIIRRHEDYNDVIVDQVN